MLSGYALFRILAVLLVVLLSSSCTKRTSLDGAVSFFSNSYDLRCWERECISGQHFMLDHEFGAAASSFRKAMKFADDDSHRCCTQLLLISAELGRSRFEEALRVALEVKKNACSAYELSLLDMDLGQCFFNLKRFDDAARSYRSCIDRNKSEKLRDNQTLLLTLDAQKSLMEILKEQGKNSELETVWAEYNSLNNSMLKVSKNSDNFLMVLSASHLAKTPENAIKMLAPELQKPEVRSNSNEFRDAMKFLASRYALVNQDAMCVKTVHDLIEVMGKDPFCLPGDKLRMLIYISQDLLECSKYDLSRQFALQARQLNISTAQRHRFDIALILAQDFYFLKDTASARLYTQEAVKLEKELGKDEKIRRLVLERFRKVSGF